MTRCAELGWMAAAAVAALACGCGRPAKSPFEGRTTHSAAIEWETSFEKALERGRCDGVPVCALFTGRWCEYSASMRGDVLQEAVVAQAAQGMVLVEVDADARGDLCRRYSIGAYPTLVFLSPLGKPVGRQVGYETAEQTALAMRGAWQAVAQRAESATGTTR